MVCGTLGVMTKAEQREAADILDRLVGVLTEPREDEAGVTASSGVVASLRGSALTLRELAEPASRS